MVVYLDVLLAVNWVIDFLLLHAAARLTRTPYRGWRLVLGAAVGAAWCGTVLLPPLPALVIAALDAAGAVAMTATAFRFDGIGTLFRRAGVLFVLSAVLAGVAMAVYVFLAPADLQVINGVVYYQISPLLLIALTALSYALLCLWGRWTRRREPLGRHYRLRITRGERTVEVPALFDSGNGLTEPFSGAPVAVAEYGAVAALLSPAWQPPCPVPPAGARLIPFSSVGGGGMLPAFRPDRLTVVGEEGEWDRTGAWVAVCDTLGSDTCALIGLELTERREHHRVGT